MANLTNLWAQEEDVRVLAGGLLKIPAPEMAQRFLPGRTPEAINMRLTYLRYGDPRARARAREEFEDMPADTSQTPEAVGSSNLLIAILEWAAKRGAVPPGLTAERTVELCRVYGVEVPKQSLKLQNAG